MSGTSLAVLAYLGFDGISTLSEEAKNPRDVLPATVFTCVAIGLLSVLEVYAAQLVWPVAEHFPDIDTAFTSVAGRAWPPLFGVLGFTLIVACVGSGTGMQLGAARLLYGMGRSGALPKTFFGAVEPGGAYRATTCCSWARLPSPAPLVLPAIAGEATGFELGASMLNFGALISFMGVNAAALVHFYVRADKKKWYNLVAPLLGFIVCLLLWWNLGTEAWILGAVWMVIGVAVAAWQTRGFARSLVSFELPPDVAARNTQALAHRAIPVLTYRDHCGESPIASACSLHLEGRVTTIGIGLVGTGYMGKAHAVALKSVGAVFNTRLRPVCEMICSTTAGGRRAQSSRIRLQCLDQSLAGTGRRSRGSRRSSSPRPRPRIGRLRWRHSPRASQCSAKSRSAPRSRMRARWRQPRRRPVCRTWSDSITSARPPCSWRAR